MAQLLRADGRIEEVRPSAPTGKWTLQELQAHVGGSVEFLPWLNKRGLDKLNLVTNEEGALRGLPVNRLATMLVRERLMEIGKPLRYMPTIYGDVVRISTGEKV